MHPLPASIQLLLYPCQQVQDFFLEVFQDLSPEMLLGCGSGLLDHRLIADTSLSCGCHMPNAC